MNIAVLVRINYLLDTIQNDLQSVALFVDIRNKKLFALDWSTHASVRNFLKLIDMERPRPLWSHHSLGNGSWIVEDWRNWAEPQARDVCFDWHLLMDEATENFKELTASFLGPTGSTASFLSFLQLSGSLYVYFMHSMHNFQLYIVRRTRKSSIIMVDMNSLHFCKCKLKIITLHDLEKKSQEVQQL